MARSKRRRLVVIQASRSTLPNSPIERVRPVSGVGPQISEINCEELDPFPLPGGGIEEDVVLGASINGRRLGIQHLERVATASRASENALGIFLSQWRWGRSGTRSSGSPRGEGLCFLLRLRRLRENQARQHH